MEEDLKRDEASLLAAEAERAKALAGHNRLLAVEEKKKEAEWQALRPQGISPELWQAAAHFGGDSGKVFYYDASEGYIACCTKI